MFGDRLITEMHFLHNKLYFRKYCEYAGIEFEDMTVNDFIAAHDWIAEQEEAANATLTIEED